MRLVRARRRPELPPALWLADDEDQAAIGDPLARIAARHAPLDSGDAGDVADGLAALVGTAGYAIKGLAGEAAVAQVIVVDGQPLDVDGQQV